MSKQIVPTVFSTTNEEFREKIELLSSLTNYVHIDICDGKFVSTKTPNIEQEHSFFFSKNLKCEFHLMVEKPLEYFELIKSFRANIVYIQVEILNSRKELEEIIEEFQTINCQVGLVFNPSTYVEDNVVYLSLVNYVMIMSVYPGAEGQSFKEEVLKKVHYIKALKPKMVVQIDGGISLETGKLALKSGSDRLAVGSYITSSKNPKQSLQKLQKLLE